MVQAYVIFISYANAQFKVNFTFADETGINCHRKLSGTMVRVRIHLSHHGSAASREGKAITAFAQNVLRSHNVVLSSLEEGLQSPDAGALGETVL